ncbi:hypothetical protein [Marinomonas vulgaris]
MRITYLGVSESLDFIAANSVRIPLYIDSVSLTRARRSMFVLRVIR